MFAEEQLHCQKKVIVALGKVGTVLGIRFSKISTRECNVEAESISNEWQKTEEHVISTGFNLYYMTESHVCVCVRAPAHFIYIFVADFILFNHIVYVYFRYRKQI